VPNRSALASVIVGEALFGRRQSFSRDGRQDPFLGHDKAVAFIKDVVITHTRGREIHGDKVGPGGQATSVTGFRPGQIQGADGGNDPVRSHQPEHGHAIQDGIDVGHGRMGERSRFTRDEWADAAAGEGQLSRQSEIRQQRVRVLSGQAGNKAGADVPSSGGEMADMLETFTEGARSLHGFIETGIGDLELHDIDTRAGGLKFGIDLGPQRAKADTDAEVCFPVQCADERQHEVFDGQGILAGLDIDVGDAGGAVVDEQVGQFIMIGAEAVEGAIIPAHAAIRAVFPAIIGDFNDGAEEDFTSESAGGGDGIGVELALRFITRVEHTGVAAGWLVVRRTDHAAYVKGALITCKSETICAQRISTDSWEMGGRTGLKRRAGVADGKIR